jgi:hypothetical protein
MVNKVFEQLDLLKNNFKLYKHNIDTRKFIISEIKIEPDVNPNVDSDGIQKAVYFASPAVPLKPKKRETLVAKINKKSPKVNKKSVETYTENTLLKNPNNSISNISTLDSDSYAKLITDFRDKMVTGLSEDSYNLKTFETCGDSIETYLWILKDLFYEGNKELRKTLKDGFNEEYAKEVNELEALDAYK